MARRRLLTSAQRRKVRNTLKKGGLAALKILGKIGQEEASDKLGTTKHGGKFVPVLDAFADELLGSGLRLAGRGCYKKGRRKNGKVVPLGYYMKMGKRRKCAGPVLRSGRWKYNRKTTRK